MQVRQRLYRGDTSAALGALCFSFGFGIFVVIAVLFCKTRSYVAHAGLKLTYKQNLELLTLPPLLPQRWGYYRCATPHPALCVLLMSAVHLASPARSSQKH